MTMKRDEIMGADDRSFEVVDVPEWNGSVRVYEMTGADRDQFESIGIAKNWANPGKGDFRTMRATLCALCMCDDQGEQIFTLEDVDELSKKSANVLNRIFEKARDLNGLGTDEGK